MVYDFYIRNETDRDGITNKTLFYEKIKRINPDYFVIDGGQPAFTPDYGFSFPQENNETLEPAALFYDKFDRPMIAIYKFKKDIVKLT
jgi:hypothetical protein